MYTPQRYVKGAMDRYELKRIMLFWPEIMMKITDDWALKFATNIWEQTSDPNWLPTLKQAHFIRAFFREHGEDDEDLELIEY